MMQVESVPIAQLVFDPSNARLHDNKNLDAIKGSLTRFGQQTPIVVDEKGVILKGNGTAAAAKALGWTNISIVRSNLSEIQKTAYAIADNRSSELAFWDNDVLAKTLLSLRDEDFNLEEIGFDDLDMAKILGDGFVPDLPDEERKPGEEKKPTLIVECESMDDLESLFAEMNERGYKVKI